ncbi:hypothetical protein MNBD_GAMMA26-485 [hydrothermal vent metagenome]|uniref:DUF6916 domain-containing protein n=1 Tax=hydrothermal vent metagenome TaxID=652676 RepID=A0A3B1B736_9ZZZZ
MLDKLSAADFSPHIGDTYTLVIHDGPDIQLELEEASEHDKCKNPHSGDNFRTPFSLTFKGKGEYTIDTGIYDLRHQSLGADDAQGLLVTRVLPEEASENSVYYQIIFS